MILVDYQKVFDMVDHNILLEKLEAYGLENRELQWCQSYLSQRKQVVQLGNTTSSEMFIMNGVHQGLILGPLSFLLFINDLALHIPSQTDLFADDTSIMESANYRNIFVLKKGNGNKKFIVSFERDSKTINRSLLQNFFICFTSGDILT